MINKSSDTASNANNKKTRLWFAGIICPQIRQTYKGCGATEE